MKNPQCLYCSQEVNRKTSKYCSVQCRASDWKERGIHHGGPPRTLPERTCLQCGTTFWRCYPAKCCSSKCMGEYRRDTGQLADFIQRAKGNTGPRQLSYESRLKMSRAAASRNAAREYTKGIGGIRPDIGHYVRSTWEANFARYLKYTGQAYTYEEDHIPLEHDGKPICYTPDFKVGGIYYEVKGWWTARSKLIRKLLQEQHPCVRISYIGVQEYKELEQEYGPKISTWEYKQRRR